jgi:hypothetical protein
VSILKSTPYPSRHDAGEDSQSPREASKKNREKEEMRARERTHANASTTPTRRKHAKQTRIHAFRAKHRAFLSSKALHNSTPFRGNLPSHREGLASQKEKMSRIRAPRATTRMLLRRRRSILARYSRHFARTRSPFNRTRRKRKERERETYPLFIVSGLRVFCAERFSLLGLFWGARVLFFLFFLLLPRPVFGLLRSKKLERERVTCIVVYFAKFARRVSKYYRCTTKTKSLSASRVFVLFFFFFFSIFHLLFLLLLLLRSCAPLLSLPRRFLARAGATRRPLPLLLVVAAASCSNLRGGR